MSKKKKVYQKPILERVVLIPQENVLAICEQGTGTGQYPPPVPFPCFPPTLGGCQDQTLLNSP
jgi:hypothetical protein